MLGENIKAARERAGLGQAELARLLKITPLRLWRYESGRARISVDMLSDVATALRVTTDSLIHGAPGEESAPVDGNEAQHVDGEHEEGNDDGEAPAAGASG